MDRVMFGQISMLKCALDAENVPKSLLCSAVFFVFCAHMFLCSDTRALTWLAQLFVESNKMCIKFFLLPGAENRNWTAGAVTRKHCNKLHPAGIDVEHQFTIRDTFARFWRKFGSFVPLHDFSLRWCVREQTADKRHMSRYLPQDSGEKLTPRTCRMDQKCRRSECRSERGTQDLSSQGMPAADWICRCVCLFMLRHRGEKPVR